MRSPPRSPRLARAPRRAAPVQARAAPRAARPGPARDDAPAAPHSLTRLLGHRRTLLLQGPMGPFFARLARLLRAHGAAVSKINFNGGDRLFFRGPHAHDYRGGLAAWAGWLREFVLARRITAIVLFGQHRPLHAPVAALARQLGIELFVFEEGYLRPSWVTLELGGVNGHSALPRRRKPYDTLPARYLATAFGEQHTGQNFARTAVLAMAYSLARAAWRPRYPHEAFHRPLNPLVECARWLRGGLRKLANVALDHGTLRELTAAGRSGRWFLLPLQVHNDSQILRHSSFADMEAVIDAVMASFAAHAAPDTWLVIKHHPMDRAYRDYSRHIARRARELGVAARVSCVHDLHLPTLLKHTRGVVTVNSTTGLQALHHHRPVITLGDCFYAVEGLVHPGPLASFWASPGRVDKALFRRFRRYLVEHTQINASFYARAPAFDLLARPAPRAGDAAAG
jgi:capsular polysaccharide export protein